MIRGYDVWATINGKFNHFLFTINFDSAIYAHRNVLISLLVTAQGFPARTRD